jgi:uncharacterized protein
MMFDPIPITVFEDFHKIFKGETNESFKICYECGGMCEIDLICPLLPGELTYIASKLNIDEDDLKNSHFDGININGIVVDVLKCTESCPFLSSSFFCSIRAFKPVICALHPIYFKIEGNSLDLLLDESCPLSQNQTIRDSYEHLATRCVEKLSIPLKWVQIIYGILIHRFNYVAMMQHRDIPVARYKIYQLDELMKFRL